VESIKARRNGAAGNRFQHMKGITMATAAPPTSDLLTAEEAAAYLGVRPQTLAVWRLNRRYPLPFIKVGSKVRYRRSDLERFLEERTIGASAE
jgi:excisionase family DNA binding protein